MALLDITEIEDRVDAGLVATEPMLSPYAQRWDKREDCDPVDCGWIGETSEGVWISTHPWVAFMSRPRLWHVYSEYCYGHRKILSRDRERRSNFELECLAALIAASNRASMAKVKDHG